MTKVSDVGYKPHGPSLRENKIKQYKNIKGGKIKLPSISVENTVFIYNKHRYLPPLHDLA